MIIKFLSVRRLIRCVDKCFAGARPKNFGKIAGKIFGGMRAAGQPDITEDLAFERLLNEIDNNDFFLTILLAPVDTFTAHFRDRDEPNVCGKPELNVEDKHAVRKANLVIIRTTKIAENIVA